MSKSRNTIIIVSILLIAIAGISSADPLGWIPDKRLTNNSAQSTVPAIAIQGSNVFVVWEDKRNGPYYDIYFKKSSDFGVTWTSDINLTSTVNLDCRYPKIALDGTNLHILWLGPGEVVQLSQLYYEKLDSSGNVLISPTWAPNWLVETTVYTYSPQQTYDIAADATGVYVVWTGCNDQTGKYDLIYNTLTGTSWSNGIRLAHDLEMPFGQPAIIRSGGSSHILVNYKDNIDNKWHILYVGGNAPFDWNYSTWSTYDSYSAGRYVDIAAQGTIIHALWVQDYSSGKQVWYRSSTDNGQNWGSSTQLGSVTSGFYAVSVAAKGNNVHVVWYSPTQVSHRKSSNGGSSWDTEKNLVPAGYYASWPDIALDINSEAHVAWQDYRDGNYEIYYKRTDNTVPLVSATPSSSNWTNSNIAITLSAQDNPGGSGIAEAKYRWDNSDAKNGTSYTNGEVITLSTEGSHTLYLWGKDNAGNENTWGSGVYKLDKTNPQVSAVPASREWTNQNISITLSATDTGGSGIAEAKYSLWPDNTDLIPYSHGFVITLVTEGTHWLALFATDMTGNTTSWIGGIYKIDKTAPIPNPAQWERAYASGVDRISMVAVPATDTLSGNVQYFFDSISSGGHDSVWQASRSYVDVGLSTNTRYGYQVKYRDGAGNATGLSISTYVYTLAPLPTNVKAEPQSANTIRLSVDSFLNARNLEDYLWQRHNGVDWEDVSTWQTWYDNGLQPNTLYRYQVSYKNRDGIQTAWVATSAYTYANVPNPPQLTLPGTGVTDRIYIDIVDPTGNPSWTKYSIRVTTIAVGGTIWYVQGSTTTGIYNLGLSPVYYKKLEWEWKNGTVVLTGLSENTQYGVSVNAKNDVGAITVYSDEVTKYTRARNPTGVQATVIDSESINLTANPFPNDTVREFGYHWECVLGAGAGSTQRTYTDTGLAPNEQYQYSIYYTNGDDVQTATVSTLPVYTWAKVPNAPSLSVPSAQLSDRINIIIDTNGNPARTKYSIKVTTVTEGGIIYYVQGSTATGIYSLGTSPSSYYTKSEWETAGVNKVVLTGLTTNTQYIVSVNAKNGDGITTIYSSTSTIYTRAKIPASPGLTVKSDTEMNVNINENGNPSWTKYSIRALSSGATYYVKLDKTLQLSPGDPSGVAPYYTRGEWGGGNLNVTGLNPNTSYQFSVNAKNGSGINTDYSLGSSSWTHAPLPYNVRAEARSSTSIQLSCNRFLNDRTGQSTYYWQRTFPDTRDLSGYTLYTSSCVIVDAGLSPNTSYEYRVSFSNYDGVRTSTVSTNRLYTFANVPANISFSDTTNQQIRVNWNANGNPTGTEYQAHCWGTAAYPLGGYTVQIDTYSSWTTEMAWLFDKLCPHTTYYFEVKARNHDNIEVGSATLSTSTLNTPPEIPVLSSPDEGQIILNSAGLVTLSALFRDATDSFSLGWTTITEEGWIRFQVSTSPDVGNYIVFSGTGNRVQSGQESGWRPPVLGNGLWYWRTKAEDMAAGYSVWSATRSFVMDYNAPEVEYFSISPVAPGSGTGNKAYTNSLTPTLTARYRDKDGHSGVLQFAISTSSTNFEANIITSTTVPVNPGTTDFIRIDFTLQQSLEYGMRFWKIQAWDVLGSISSQNFGNMNPWSFIVNRPPDAPQLVSPADGYTTYVTTPTFKVNYSDQDANLSFGDRGTNGDVRIQISTSSTDWSPGSILVDSGWLYALNKSTVTWNVVDPIRKDGDLYFGRLYWQAIARDTHTAVSFWSQPRSLEIQNVPPDSPALLNVSPRNPYPDSNLTFSWLFTDKNMRDSQTYYEIQLDWTTDWDSPIWSTMTAMSGSWNSMVEVVHSGSAIGLEYDKTYYWRVRVWDQEGACSGWSQSQASFKTSIFGTPEPSAEADDTRSIAIGDLNNDGYLDYVVGNYGTNRVYLNSGEGTDWDPVDLSGTENTYTKSVVLADVNNDGYLDIIFGNSGGSGQANQVCINDPGNPGRWFTVSPSAETEKTYSIAVGDLDNDGDIDYVAGNIGQAAKIYRNDGGSLVSSGVTLNINQTYSVAIGDVDNDGDLDIVAGLHNNSPYNLILYRNNGDGGLNFTKVDISCDVDVNAVALGDLDGDGYLDICAGTSGGNNSRIYWNNGTGTFTNASLAESGYNTTSVALGDLDNDGHLDIVLGNLGSPGSPNLIYRNFGSRQFTLYELSVEQDATNSVALGDLDDDGDLDLVAGNGGSQPNRIYRSRKSVTIYNGPPTPPQELYSQFVGGKLELSWDDEGDDKSGADELYYAFRLWNVNGSTVVSGCYGTPLMGNYIRPKLEDGSLGIKLKWTQGTTCFWQVRTIDSGLKASAWSDVRAYAPGLLPPRAPTNFGGVAVSATEINWTWRDNSSGDRQETSFKLYDRDHISEPIATVLPDITSYLEAGLSPNTSYYRFVRAWNIAGSSDSAVASAWTLANEPVGPGVFDVYSTSITAHWLDNGNPAGTEYLCRFGNSPDVTGPVIGDSGWTTYTLWTSTGLRERVEYYFWVKAKNHSGQETNWVALGSTHIGSESNNLPTVEFVYDPVQLRDGSGKFDIVTNVTDIDDNECMLGLEYSTGTVWNRATVMDAWDVNGTTLPVDNGREYQISGISDTSSTNTITFKWDSKKDLPPAEYNIVRLRVKVYDGYNSGTDYATVSVDLYCQAPASFWCNERSTSTLTFGWSQTPGVNGYEIWYSTEATLQNYQKAVFDNGAATIGTITELTPNTTYYSKICSYDSFGNTGLREGMVIKPTEVAQPGPPVVRGLYRTVGGFIDYYTRISLDLTTVKGNPPDTQYAIKYTGNQNWLQGNGDVGGNPVLKTASEWQTGDTNTHTGLGPNTSYGYIVRAYGYGGERKESSSVGYATTPPEAPTITGVVGAPTGAPDYLKVSWTAPGGATSYKVYVSTILGGEAIDVVTGIAETSHDYDVDGGTPTAVTSIQVKDVRDKEIHLSWTKPIGELEPSATYYFKVSGVNGYESEGPKSSEKKGQLRPVIAGYILYRYNLIASSTYVIRTTGSQPINDFEDTTVTPNTRYSYSVSAVSSDGLEGPLSSSTLPTYTLAAVPEPRSFSNVTTTSIQANWGANENPEWTRYRVECSTNTFFTVTVDSEDWTENMLSWSATDLSVNTSYWFRVQARNLAGTTTEWRILGSTYTLAVTPGAPILEATTTPKGLLAILVKINPQGNPEYTEYSIKARYYENLTGWVEKYLQAPEGGLAVMGDTETFKSYGVWGGTNGVTNIQDTDTNLIGNTTYYYQVTARNGSGIKTDAGPEASLETPPWIPVIWAKASDGRDVQPGDFINVDKVTFTIIGSDRYYFEWTPERENVDVSTTTSPSLAGPKALTTLTIDGETGWYLYVLGWSDKTEASTGKSVFGPITYDIQRPTVELKVNSGRILPDGEIVGVLPEPGETSMEAIFTKVMKITDGLELVAIRNNLNEAINEKVPLNFEWDASTKTVTLTLKLEELKKNYLYKLQVTDTVTDLAGNTVSNQRELVFRTIMDYRNKNIIAKQPTGSIIITLEENALTRDGYLVINPDPLTRQEKVDAEKINQANKNILGNGDRYQYPIDGCLWEFVVYDREGKQIDDGLKFNTKIVLPYTDDGQGMVGNSTLLVKEETLRAFWLDEQHSIWVRVPSSKVDKENNIITVEVLSFSVYAIMGSAFYDLSEAHAYPVPWKPNDGKEDTGTEEKGITFTKLSTEGIIKIYTISGELVMRYEFKPVDSGQWKWDVRTPNGEKVFSGVYIYYIENEKEHKIGKLIIIR